MSDVQLLEHSMVTLPIIRRILILTGVTLIGLSAPALAQADRYGLRGDIVTPDGVIEGGTDVVSGGLIESVGQAPAGVRVVDTGGVICPGLIDLHNHLTWNVFPRWSSGMKFASRYDWQQLPSYIAALETPHAALISEGLGPKMARYAEVKAIAGGATSLAGLYAEDLGPAFHPPYPGMMRMLDLGSRLYPDGTPEPVRYQVFPLVLSEADAQDIRAALNNHTLRSLLIHLAEGAPTDASSRMEFRILKARGLLLPGVTLIHGVALHQAQFEEMAKLGVGLVWSPRSNFELYGATADIAAAKKAGVRIAIAPDWSPTGSDGMLQELKYAAEWNAAQPSPVVSEAELVTMATREAARLCAAEERIGSIAPGKCADLLVLGKGTGNAYHTLVTSGPADVTLVIVGGRPVYGSAALAPEVAPRQSWTTLSVAGVSKEVSLPGDPARGDWTHLTLDLDTAMKALGTHLGPIAP